MVNSGAEQHLWGKHDAEAGASAVKEDGRMALAVRCVDASTIVLAQSPAAAAVCGPGFELHRLPTRNRAELPTNGLLFVRRRTTSWSANSGQIELRRSGLRRAPSLRSRPSSQPNELAIASSATSTRSGRPDRSSFLSSWARRGDPSSFAESLPPAVRRQRPVSPSTRPTTSTSAAPTPERSTSSRQERSAVRPCSRQASPMSRGCVSTGPGNSSRPTSRAAGSSR